MRTNFALENVLRNLQHCKQSESAKISLHLFVLCSSQLRLVPVKSTSLGYLVLADLFLCKAEAKCCKKDTQLFGYINHGIPFSVLFSKIFFREMLNETQ